MAHTRRLFIITCIILVSFPSVFPRIQLKPPEDIKVERIPNGPPCMLDVNTDLNEPQPLFLHPGSADFWPVETKGYLEIDRGEVIELHCTKGFQMRAQNKNLNATCLEDRTFLVDQEKFTFRVLNCTSQVKYSVRETRAACADYGTLYEVGFNVSVNRFVKTMDICYDKLSVNTLWTYKKLNPANVHFQKSVKRLNFSTAGFFDKRNMNHFYSKEHQKQIFEDLLGRNYEKFFNNRTQFLSRGHLSAKTDHIFSTQQRATFNFFNTAPQWQIFNAGTWNAVENGVRQFISAKALTVDCYTGTWGVLSLPNERGEPTDIYLSFDENNNGEVPVPKLFYKVLVDRKTSRGIVLIGVNNPYLSMDELRRDYIICDDVSEWVPWIKWRRNNISKGYFYTCGVDDFVRAVKTLPSSLEGVEELLV